MRPTLCDAHVLNQVVTPIAQGDGSTGQQRHPVTPLSDMRFSHFAACSPQQSFSPLWKRDAALDAV
jgi:hypothetical protein